MKNTKITLALTALILLLLGASIGVYNHAAHEDVNLDDVLAEAEETLERELIEADVTPDLIDPLPEGPAESGMQEYKDFGFEAIAPKEKTLQEIIAESEAELRRKKPVYIGSMELQLPVSPEIPEAEYAEMMANSGVDEYGGIDGSHKTMLTAPHRQLIIKTDAEYNKFKKTAEGSYPKTDFKKQNLLVMLSDSNLPDNVFEIIEVKEAADGTEILFRVNILGLKKRAHSHAFTAVKKNAKNIKFTQVR